MAGHPSEGELVAAVREFIAGLPLTGRDAFHAKVAANVLAIVEREQAANVDAVEAAALARFASGTEAGVALRTALCAAIRAGTLDVATPGLLDALIVATCARLAVDNPRYPTLARLAPGAAPQR